VLGLARILFCDGCETETARTQRGWRAYLTTGSESEPAVKILCPACAEQGTGEDEAAWSD
jgi:hypothetical protein